MSFNQRRLERSIQQTREIFDRYIYRTGDDRATVTSPGYFASSRFKLENESDWNGSIIDCETGDGYLVLRVLPGDQVQAIFDSGGSGLPADNARIGFVDYNDAATSVSPINIPAATPVQLTNDTLGPQTLRTYLPVGVTDIWNPATNQFDFSQLKKGDMVDIRIDGELTTTSNNQNFSVDMVFGIGVSEYSVPFASGVVRRPGIVQASRFNGIYIGSALTRDNPAEFRIVSDDPASIVISGWYCKILVRG